MNKNNSLSYSVLRKKSQLQTSDTQKLQQPTPPLKSRAKSITSTTIKLDTKKPIAIIKPPAIDISKVEVSPFTFANRISHNSSTDQTYSRNSDIEVQGTTTSKLHSQEQIQQLNRQKQLLEYRLRQESESNQQFTQNYHTLQERMVKLRQAQDEYIHQMNQFSTCLKLILNGDD